MALEKVRDLQRVLAVAIQAHSKRLQAAQREKAVERPEDRTDGVLQKAQPVAPVPASVADHQHAGDKVRMTAEVLGRRVHYNVDAMFERPLHAWTGERIVGGAS